MLWVQQDSLSSLATPGRFLSSSTQDCLTKTPLYASEVLVAPPADDSCCCHSAQSHSPQDALLFSQDVKQAFPW